MASLEVHSRIYDYMSRYQFFQDTAGRVTIFAVPLPGLKIDNTMLNEIESTFCKRTGNNIEFRVETVEEIKPYANGKISIINQKLNVEDFI